MKRFITLTALICSAMVALAQNTEEEAIKKTIQAEADAIVNRDLDAWKAVWKHDPTVSTTFISNYGYSNRKGWDSLAAGMERNWKANPKPEFTQMKAENYSIRTNGTMAWVDFDAVSTLADAQSDIFPYMDATWRLHNYEVLVKENDQWKIVSRIITAPDTYKENDLHAVETDLNAAGYQLMAAKKMNEAIDVFKLNVKLFPDSWNTYDSLGEAYALAGNKKLAIENYEKSIKLNPKSTSGQETLAKLKVK